VGDPIDRDDMKVCKACIAGAPRSQVAVTLGVEVCDSKPGVYCNLKKRIINKWIQKNNTIRRRRIRGGAVARPTPPRTRLAV